MSAITNIVNKMSASQKRRFLRGDTLACGSLRPTLHIGGAITKELRKQQG